MARGTLREYSVRRAEPGDAACVDAVRKRAIRESAAGFYDSQALEAWASESSAIKLRQEISTTTGFVAAHRATVVAWASLDGEAVAELYVDPEHGGKALARRLLGVIEEHARGDGRSRLLTEASARSIPVFARLGYVEIRRAHRTWSGHSYEVADMQLLLNHPAPDFVRRALPAADPCSSAHPSG